jgi:hypothetical protein
MCDKLPHVLKFEHKLLARYPTHLQSFLQPFSLLPRLHSLRCHVLPTIPTMKALLQLHFEPAVGGLCSQQLLLH